MKMLNFEKGFSKNYAHMASYPSNNLIKATEYPDFHLSVKGAGMFYFTYFSFRDKSLIKDCCFYV